jgi:CheY-like chemotaxis protein
MSKNKRVLIVDDLKENLDLYSLFIHKAFPSVEIATAANGREALETISDWRPDLIMLDAMMPDMDGFEVCALLKNDPATASILVLMVSAVLIDSKNRATGLNVGADGYLCKPFEREELVAQIKAFFRLRDSELALDEARLKAVQATETKTRFLAQMSHEIRTPMNAVIGMTELILGTDLSREQRDMAETIRQSGESLLRIINDILDFSKIESGKLDIHRTEFRLTDCVEAVVNLLAYSAQSKGLELAWWIEENVPQTICTDYDRLRQLLLNLAGNAVKFTSEGEVYIRVEMLDADSGDTGDMLRFSVRDTGIGITAADQKLLFEPFTQVDPSNTRKFQGTGLGLAICGRIVEMMGGEIGVESCPGEGSTFFFTLPMPQPVHAEISESADPAALRGQRVLIVDDTEINRHISRKLAEGWGMEVAEAHDANSAMESIHAEESFDLILLDMHMPGEDGLRLAARIRGETRCDKAAIIMLTSVGEHDDAAGMARLNISAWLAKPLRPNTLKAAACKALGLTASATPEQKDVEQTGQRPLAETHPYRILLAEDNIVNQKVAEKMVAKLGYTLDCVENGEAAVARLQSENYDVVLMDMQMPVMDGWEATRIIRNEIEPERQPYIIAMTAGAMREDRQKCFAAGLDAFVPKPIRLDELVGALKAASSGERYGDE